MQLRIENIGQVSSAVVDLTGLTVIGGFNDTGKSTIGKVLFSIVKAIRNREEQFAFDQQNKIAPIISELISELRSNIGPVISPSNISSILRRFQDIQIFDGENGLSFFDSVSNDITENLIAETRRREPLIRRITLGGERSSNEDRINQIENIIREITHFHFLKVKEVVFEKQDLKAKYSASFNSILNSIFDNEVNSKILLADGRRPKGYIKILDNGQKLLSILFDNNKLDEREFHIEANATFLFDDVTLLESPFILNFKEDLILAPRTSAGEYLASYPTYDLLEKISLASREVDSRSGLEREIVDIVSKTIEGKVYFDSDEQKFIFSSINNINVSITNTASGVKALGILQMLARAGILTTSNLLIVDEPEVHLHPAWQIVYAEIIAILVKKYNLYCLVSSHSPYFIQAIEAYSKIYKMENLTKFYISEKHNNSCILRDITENPEPLYKLLADPMKKIAYLRAKAQNE